MAARIDKTVVSGVFSLDGSDFDVVAGGPGATGRSYSDEPTLLDSIGSSLLPLPEDTVVRTGHGDDTTIAAEVCRVG